MAVGPDLVAREIAARDFDQGVDEGLIGVALSHPAKLRHNTEFAKRRRDVNAGRVPPS